MKKFKLYGFQGSNLVLITNSSNISPASSYDEQLSIQRHLKSSLSFKINDKIVSNELNPFISLIYPGAKLKLVLENQIDSNLDIDIDFIIKNINNEFYKDMIVYNVSAEDLASVQYAKLGINLTFSKTGTLEELVKEILAETRVNPGYYNASYNYLDTINYRYLNNATYKDGILKTLILNDTQVLELSFNRKKNLKTSNNYHLSFYLVNSEELINLKIIQYNAFGILINDPILINNLNVGQQSILFVPEETMSYFSIIFSSENNTSLIISDIKLYKDLDSSVENYIYLSPNFNPENFKASDDITSYNYYKKVTMSLNNSNLYNAIIELCNLFDAVLETEYNINGPATLNFIPRTSEVYRGYRLSPDFNLSSISRDEDFSEFITSLRIKGQDNNTSIYPKMPDEFLSYFNNCIQDTATAVEDPFIFASNDFNDYSTKSYSDIANDILGDLDAAAVFEREDILYAYAYACDKVPNFENTIYNIDYFKTLGKISLDDYNLFMNKIYNDLRVLNIKLKIFSDRYYQALTEYEVLDNEIDFNCQTISVENLNKYDLNKLLSETYEYDHLDVELVGDNLIKNSNFSNYGTNDQESSTYNIPSYWVLPNEVINNKPFIINKDFLTSKGNNSLKFKDIISKNISYMTIFLDPYSRIEIDNKYIGSKITVSAEILLDKNFVNYYPQLNITYYPSGTTISTTINDFTNLHVDDNLSNPLKKEEWIRIFYTTQNSIPSGTTSASFSISVINTGSRNADSSIFYIAQPQFEIRDFMTDWSDDIIYELGTAGVNLLPNTTFDQEDNTTPNGWTNYNKGTFTIVSNYNSDENTTTQLKHDGKKVLKFNYSSSLSNSTYIAADYVDIKSFNLTSRAITFSGYIYKPSIFWTGESTAEATLSNPLYLRIRVYDSNKNLLSITIDKEFIYESNIGVNDSWISFKRTFTIPDKSEIRYIKPFIGYEKTDTSKGKNTDLIFLSLLQLEFGSRASSWTPIYDLDGERYKTYKFILKNHKFVNGNKVKLEYYSDDIYIYNIDKYPAINGTYFVVQADTESFKLSSSLNGNPIKYNEEYIKSNSDKWKLSSSNLQYKSPEWVTIQNSIADREDLIEKSTLNNFNLMNIVYNEYYEPIRLELENNDIKKIKINSFIDKLFTLYGYNNSIDNGLVYRIEQLKNLIIDSKNIYDTNKKNILDLIVSLNSDNLSNYDRNLKETNKAGLIASNENSKFTIGIFNQERTIVDNNNKTILIYLPSSAVDERVKTLVIPETFDTDNLNFIGKYVKIQSLDNQETYIKYIIDQVDNELTIEYFPKAEKQYNIYILDIIENFNDPIVLGQYQTKLYFYNLIMQFLNSYTYENSLIDYSLWSQYYIDQDRSARISNYWNYDTFLNDLDIVGNAVITYQDYGNNNYDYMIKIYPYTSLISYFVIDTNKALDIKTLIKVVDNLEVPIDGNFSIGIYKNNILVGELYSKEYYTNNWDIIKTNTSTLNSGSYEIRFINNSNYSVYLYRPAIVSSGSLLTNEEIYALYDNPQTKDYIETINVEIDSKIGLYDIIVNKDSNYNLVRIKDIFLGELYNDYYNFLFEGYYENSEEIDSFGLLEQAIINSEKFRTPKIVYNTSIIDLSALQNYNYLNVKVGDKIIIAEPSDRLYRSYTQEEDKELLISNISYNLRDMSSTSLTVERDNETKILIQKLLKNIT